MPLSLCFQAVSRLKDVFLFVNTQINYFKIIFKLSYYRLVIYFSLDKQTSHRLKSQTMDVLTDKQIRAKLKDLAHDKGTQKAAAKELNVSPQYFGDVINGTRPVEKLALKLGYKKRFVKEIV